MVLIVKRFDPAIHHRRSIRLKGFDYRGPGVFFITLNTSNHLRLFGKIENRRMNLNEFGLILHEEWLMTEKIRSYVWLDEFVIMPDHFHGIICIDQSECRRGDTTCRPDESCRPDNRTKNSSHRLSYVDEAESVRPNGPKSGSLGAIIGQFKMQCTKRIKSAGYKGSGSIWQRNYYERIIRNESALNRIRKYINANPSRGDSSSRPD